MPMYSRCLISETIIDIYDYGVAAMDINSGTRELIVDANDRPLKSIWASIHPMYMPIIVDSFGQTSSAQDRQDKKV